MPNYETDKQIIC